MSDLGRKDLSDKIGDKVTPDSQKSTVDKVGDNLTTAADKVSANITPDSEKSTTQKAADKLEGSKDQEAHGSKGAGVLDSVKNAFK